MKLSEVLKTLEHIKGKYGDVEVYLQAPEADEGESVAHELFFIVPELYRPEDGSLVVNMRTWPY